jgi:hypothetical protein
MLSRIFKFLSTLRKNGKNSVTDIPNIYTVPDKRIGGQRVRPTLVSKLHLCDGANMCCPFILMMIICNSVCVHVLTRELQARHQNLGEPSQTGTVGRAWKRLWTVPSTEGDGEVSLLRTWRWGGPIRISTSNMLAAQVCPHLVIQMQKDYHTSV